MMKKLVELLLLSQEELYARIDDIYAPMYEKEVFEGSLIFKPKNVEMYPLICTHLDTINTHRDYKLTKDDIALYDTGEIKLHPSSQAVCLGGDDRCGVFLALELMAKGVPYAFGFFLDEEVGGIGSDNYSTIIDTTHITALVGLDRRGYNDVALYGYDNQELTEIFTKQGYKEAMGTFTDASNLAGVCGLACINLSIGYYNEHTPNEQIHFSETENTLNMLHKPEVIEALASKQYLAETKQNTSNCYTIIDIANFPIIEVDGEELLVTITPTSPTRQGFHGELVTFGIEGYGFDNYSSLDELFTEIAYYSQSMREPLIIDSSKKPSKKSNTYCKLFKG